MLKQMNKFAIALLIAGLACAGCGKPVSSESTNKPQKPFDITSMVTVDEIKSQLNENQLPTSAGQLHTEFVEHLRTDPERALVDYTDWDSVPESKRAIKLGGLLTFPFSIGRDKQYELKNDRLYTVAEYGKLIDCTVDEYNEGRDIPITHVLELEYKLSENGTQTGTIDVGERGGQFYLYPEAD